MYDFCSKFIYISMTTDYWGPKTMLKRYTLGFCYQSKVVTSDMGYISSNLVTNDGSKIMDGERSPPYIAIGKCSPP